jgi:hypothetical protein
MGLSNIARSYEKGMMGIPGSDEEINAIQRSQELFMEGAANAALKTLLLPADYLLFPIKMVTGVDYELGLNFQEKGSVIQGSIGKRNRLDIAKDQTFVYPMAEFVSQTAYDAYFGLMYQGGQSTLGESSRENLTRTAGAVGFNVGFWGSVGKSALREPANYVETSSVTKSPNIIKYNAKAGRYYDANTGKFIKDMDTLTIGKNSEIASRLPETYWPKNHGFLELPRRKFLMPGERIDRYGFEGGKFVSPVGVPFEMRGLPIEYFENKPYHVYEIVKPFEVKYGKAAPAFGKIGLGMQYELPLTINKLMKKGIIRRIK